MSLAPTEDEVWDLHMDLLQTQDPGDFSALGEDEKMIAQLTTLLTNKGVPAAVVASRVIVQKLGKNELLKAVSSNNPWNALKALASKPGHSIQLVHKDELAAQLTLIPGLRASMGPQSLHPRSRNQSLPQKLLRFGHLIPNCSN